MKNVLNITNGKHFNDYISKHLNGVFYPFNEAFIEGELTYPLFDEVFINKRVENHYKLVDEYNVKEYSLLMGLFIDKEDYLHSFECIKLWFGDDTFCLINLLGLLTYLEQINYRGEVLLNVINEEIYSLDQNWLTINLGTFSESYKALFVNKKVVYTNNLLIDKGIDMYNYLNQKDNIFHIYIKENIEILDRNLLLINLLKMSKEYGLSDIYLTKMIDEHINKTLK